MRFRVGEEAAASVRSMLEEADRGATVIRKLSKQLLAFSRETADKQSRMDLRQVIDDSLFLTQTGLRKGSLVVDDPIAADRHFTIGSPNQMQRVFVNLIGNAADAMSETQERALRLSIPPESRDGVDYWKCDVSDTGPGMPADVVERVFDSFFTTKGAGEGTGLGLSISRGIVSEHEGTIEIDTRPGVGTAFFVYLRRANA